MKKLIFLTLICVSSLSAQWSANKFTIVTQPFRVKDSTQSILPFIYYHRNDTDKVWFERDISGDNFSAFLRVRSLKKYDGGVWAGIEAVSPGNDSTLAYVRTLSNRSVKIGGSRFPGASYNEWYNQFDSTGMNAVSQGVAGYGFHISGYGTGTPVFDLQKASGSITSPTALSSGGSVANFRYLGYNGSAFVSAAQIAVTTTENWTGSANGAYLVIRTGTTGSTAVTERMRLGSAGVSIMTGADATARLDIAAGDSANGISSFRIRPMAGIGPPSSLSGGGYFWDTGTYLLHQRASGVWDTLSVVRGTGGTGTFAGWSRFSAAGIYTATAGDYVHLRVNAGDTTGTKLLTNYGTTDLRGTFNSSADWTVRDTTIFTSATFTFEKPTIWHGDTLESGYIGTRLSDKTIDGESYFIGTGGIDITGNITTTGNASIGQLNILYTGTTQAYFKYDSDSYRYFNINNNGDMTVGFSGAIANPTTTFVQGTNGYFIISGASNTLEVGDANGQARLALHSASTGYGNLVPTSSASNYTLTMPALDGKTLATIDGGQTFTSATIGGTSDFTGSGGINTSGTVTISGTTLITGVTTIRNATFSIGSTSASADIRIGDGSGHLATLVPGTLGGNWTWTFPNATGTLATLNGGQTFTNAIWNGTALGDAYIASASAWNTAYTQRLQWDGGSTNLVAATGRASLNVPTRTGGDASGTWAIDISGTAAKVVSSSVTNTMTVAAPSGYSAALLIAKSGSGEQMSLGMNSSGYGYISATSGIIDLNSSQFINVLDISATTLTVGMGGIGSTGSIGIGGGASQAIYRIWNYASGNSYNGQITFNGALTASRTYYLPNESGTIYTTAGGYLTSALGSTADPGANPQYLVGIADTHEIRVYVRTLTINGTTVHVLTTD